MIVEFDDAAVRAAAQLLATSARVEPYAVRGAPVYRLTVRNPVLAAEVAVILWPSLRRVDVRVGDSAAVLKGIDEVALYPGVEVMFRRRHPPAALFVSVGGRFGITA
ncbi:MAG: hypothetical protein U0531_15245 [Dehalococcoidia bacterium]